ncbi:MAG: recombinase family protein [Geobacter sp.]|nr:recombinase family protein [Geobacter sp.]
MPKAYSYQRFSTIEQQRGDSLRRQTDLAATYCKQHGLDLVESYADLGVSAFRGGNVAPETRLSAFLDDVRARPRKVPEGSYFLVESLDRLSRNKARHALRILESICDEGVTVVTLNDGKVYTAESLDDDPTALLMSLLIFVRANNESEEKSKRGRANWQQKRDTAITEPLTEKLPAWCRLIRSEGKKTRAGKGVPERIELIPERAAIVKQMFADYLAGVGQVTIAKRLNLAKVPCWGRAMMWHTSYISKILSSPSVMGVYVPHLLIGGKGGERIKQEPIHGYFPAVVSESDYNKVQSLRKIGCFAGQKSEVLNILSNLAKCPLCGSTMRRVRNGARARAKLICVKAKAGAGCMGYGVDYQQLEATFIAGVTSITVSVPSVTKQQRVIADLQTTINRHKQALTNIMQAIQSGQQTPDADIFGGGQAVPVTMLQAVQYLESKIDEEEKELSRLQQALALVRGDAVRERVKELRRFAAAADLDRAAINAVLLSLCSHVVVDYVHNNLILHLRAGATVEVAVNMADEAIQHRAMRLITGQLMADEVI